MSVLLDLVLLALSVAALWYGSAMVSLAFIDKLQGDTNGSRFRMAIGVVGFVAAALLIYFACR